MTYDYKNQVTDNTRLNEYGASLLDVRIATRTEPAPGFTTLEERRYTITFAAAYGEEDMNKRLVDASVTEEDRLLLMPIIRKHLATLQKT